jgi:transcriptional regulator with XRE-family HTH domain
MMRPIHLRMARAALGWTLKDLADRAKVNLNTVSRYEAGFEILSGTMQKIEDVLRAEGVDFIEEDADFEPAIRKRKRAVRIRNEPLFEAQFNEDVRPFVLRRQISKTKPKSPSKRKS